LFFVVCVCVSFSRQQNDDFIFSAHIFVVAARVCACVGVGIPFIEGIYSV